MKDLQKNKTALVAILLFVSAIFVYNSFFKTEVVVDPGQSVTAGPGGDVIKLNSAIESVTLDRALFGNKLYQSLVDFSTELSPLPMGRQNPFGPLGNEGSSNLQASSKAKTS